jgi:hypothetical protein
MNKRAFRRAMRYGFGRAILHLQQHDAAQYRDDIVDGCLHDWTGLPNHHYRRADYMFEIVSLTGERDYYRDHILKAVGSASDDLDGHHVFELAWLFADAGDEAARDALNRAIERLPFDHELASHVVALQGTAGLARVVQLRFDRLDADGGVYGDDGDVYVDDNNVGLGLFWLFGDEGDEVERDALDRALERLPFDDRLRKIANAFHGPAGLARVIRSRLDHLDATGEVRAPDDIIGWWVVDDAYERWGKRAVAAAMRDAGRADSRIKALWTAVRRRVEKGRQDWKASSHPPPLTYEQVKQFLAWPGSDPPDWDPSGSALHGWMTNAPDDEWRQMAEELAALPDDDLRWQHALDWLYDRRAYPGDPHCLIATIRAARLDRYPTNPYNAYIPTTERVALDAMQALAQMTQPVVRSFALELLETSKWTGEAARLLARDFWPAAGMLAGEYVDGDLELLATTFRRERSEQQRHGICGAVLAIDRQLEPVEAPPVLLLLYEHIRCFECRADILVRLIDHAALPAAIASECCFDADIVLREKIAEWVPGACAGSDNRARSDSGIDSVSMTRP